MKTLLTTAAILGLCMEAAGYAQEATLLRTITFDGFRANEIYPADINGDGQMELLCLQSAGSYKSDLYDGSQYSMTDAQQSVCCLTAIKPDGTRLWQFGTPDLSSPGIYSHVADQMVACGNLSGNGQPQIALLTKSTLEILGGATGAALRSTNLGADNFSVVHTLRTQQGTRLLVSNQVEAYSPYQYGSPTCVYDPVSLSRLATVPSAVAAGHCPRGVDLNGDGNDELLAGLDAYDIDGNKLWTLSGDHRTPTTYYHLDQLAVGKLGEPRSDAIVYAASGDVEAGAFDGTRLWHNVFGHAQYVLFGGFRAEGKTASMAVYCCYGQLGAAQKKYIETSGIPAPSDLDARDNIAFLNDAGEIVGLVFPTKDIDLIHSGQGILVCPRGASNGSDAIITRDWGWPQALTMSGDTAFLIPEPEHPYGLAPTPDWNDGYGVQVVDLNSDGRSEILIHDQLRAWIYESPYPAPEPGTLMLLVAAGLSVLGYVWRKRR
jgi:hypothetical protein